MGHLFTFLIVSFEAQKCLFIYLVVPDPSCSMQDLSEKAMAIHSSVLAWKIPWTEEPDRLQSTGLQESDTT